MRVLDYYLRAPAGPVTDDTIVRMNGTTGDLAQASSATLSDTNVLTLSTDNAQVIAGGTLTGITVATIAQTAKGMFLVESTSSMPAVMMVRAAAGDTAGPSFNFVRSGNAVGGAGSLASPVVVRNGASLGNMNALGFDATDYAVGGQIDFLVDEADTGSATVAANSMGTKIVMRTSRRGTQVPALSVAVRHNGALQLNTAMTLAPLTNTGMGGCMEADAKVQYYTPEDGSRGVVGAKYIICPTGTNALTATTPEQALFDDVGTGTLTIPTGTYLWSALISMATMEAAAATNFAFDILGAGTATIAALYMNDGGENAINTSGANTMSMSALAQSPATIVTGAASANLQVRCWGIFRCTVAGTIIPSVTLGTAGGTPTRSANSFFMCECIGTSTVQTVGAWS